MLEITKNINRFSPISLKEMDGVKLLNRVDTKFVLSVYKLSHILNDLVEKYKVLEINGKRIMSYQTKYYDTVDFRMYNEHQNGKLNRFKVREREYMDSDINFLEVKFKNNKRRTVKSRIIKKDKTEQFNDNEVDFINCNSPVPSEKLELKLFNTFNRITLTNQIERVTIDFGLGFNNGNGTSCSLPYTAIVEVKQSKFTINSDVVKVLKKHQIRPSGFSKYCIGSTFIYPSLKSNRFKSKLLLINKLYA